MVFTPRKRAAPTTTFDNTWNEADAAFLDPNALPVNKIPRAWERKQEIKRVGEGKEKKIWRRFNLRSRADDTTQESEDDEEQDAHSRPVKRRQHVSPKAMEKSTSRLGKKRAFKATRWDRRRSVLPRKRVTQTEHPGIDANDDANSEEEEDSTHSMEGEVSIDRTNADMDEQMKSIQTPPSMENDNRSTFTITIDAQTADVHPNHESVDRDQDEELESTGDVMLAKLFCSPTKQMSSISNASPEKVEYPELPLSEGLELEVITLEGTPIEDKSKSLDKNIAEELISVIGGLQEDVEARTKEVVSNQTETRCEETEAEAELQYPALPLDDTSTLTAPPALDEDSSETETEEAELSEVELDNSAEEGQDINMEDIPSSPEAGGREEEFTEASLQLDILREYQTALQEHDLAPASAHPESDHFDQGETDDKIMGQYSSPEVNKAYGPVEASTDIAHGLMFSFTPTKPQSPAPRRLHSPPPPPRPEPGPDDTTMTVAFDDDTAILKDFLTRAAASKAEKAAVSTHKRESLQNRRDSDVVRHALASPRKVLEEKDPNSPSKQHMELTLDLSQTPALSVPTETLPSPTPGAAETESAEEKNAQASRRSSRTKKTRLPAPASTGPAPAPKINIRRADGNEVVVLKKDDAKVLADMTRNNTRKNKQGTFCVTVRLMKLAMDAYSLPPIDDATKEIIVGKNVRWDETLAYYQENPDTIANALAEAESLSTPDELGLPDAASEPKKKKKEKTSKTSTPKTRRVRGLGTTNGTPGKGLLAPASLLPEAVQEEKEASQDKHTSKPNPTKVKKMPVASSTSTSTSIDSSLSSSTTDAKLASLDVAPVGVQPASQRKSRLAAPRKVVLPQTPSSAKVGDKENVTRLGISEATPKKGLPAPKVIMPSTASVPAALGMESGLPRRRGRKY